ncbi:MAG TPA: hypothetical protein PKD91_04205 [Bacteroidia bacterium]|nr:hypothetical protein [Bacteroidia bacterium]
MMICKLKNSLGVFLLSLLIAVGSGVQVYSQVKAKPVVKATPAKATPRISTDKQIIDSLETELEVLNARILIKDSLYQAEKFTTADLRDQVIKLDDYRLKLEGNLNSFKGENLKLNQSNRILIVFNSLVAVLLVISLVFFLKKLGAKKKPSGSGMSETASGIKTGSGSFITLEEKLQQLERLGKLKEKGLLSESEFLTEKQQILGK